MSDNRDIFTSEIYVNNQQANDAIAEMTKQLTKLTDKYDDLAAKNEKLAEKTDKAKAAMDETTKKLAEMTKGTDEYAKTAKKLDQQTKSYNDLTRQVEVSKHKMADAEKEMNSMKESIKRAEDGVGAYRKAIDELSGKSMNNLKRMQSQLRDELDKTKPNTKEWSDLADQYAKVTSRIKWLEKVQQDILVKQGSIFQRMAKGLNDYYGAITLTIGAIRRGVAAFSNTYKTISNFEQANANLSTILGVNRDQMKALEDAALELGSTTRYTASEVTNLQTELAKLGFTQKEILDMGPSVLNFATAVGTDLASAAAMAGVALRSFEMQSDQTEDVLGTMAVACNKSALSFEYLQNAFSTIAPVAKSYGLGLKDTVALLGTLANAGFDASSAATATRNILLKMVDANGELAKSLGGSVKTFDDIMDGMIKLRDSGLDLAGAFELTDKRSVSAFSTFLRGAESAKELRASIEDVNGALAATAEVRADTVEGAIAGLQSAWEGFVLSFRNSSGTVKEMVNTLTDFVRRLPQYSDNIAKITKSVLAVVLAIKAWTLAEKAKNAAVTTGHKLAAAAKVVYHAVRLAYFNMTGQTVKATAAQTALNAAMAANPFGAVVAVVATLTAAIGLLVGRQREAVETTDLLAEADKRANEKYDEQAGKVKALTSIVENNNISLAERKKALDELKAIVPGYHGDLTEEGRLINSNKEAIDEYCKSLREKIRLEARKDQLLEIEKQIAALEDQKADAQERQHQALVESGGDTTEIKETHSFWRGQQLSFTDYGQAKKDEADAQKQIDELEGQAKKISDGIGKIFTDPIDKVMAEYEAMFDQIRKESVDNPKAANEEINRLREERDLKIAELRKTADETKKVVSEENAILTQTQFDFLEGRYDKLTKKEKAMVDAGYAALSAEDSKALKARYDKLMKADGKAADQRYQADVKRIEQRQREEQNLINQQFFAREITAEQHEKALRDITMKYLVEKLELAKANGKDITQIDASILSERMKNRKSDYDEDLKQLEARQKEEEQSLSLSLSAEEITEKEYQAKSLELKMRYLEEKLKLTLESGQDETAVLQAIFDAQIEAEKAAYDEMKKLNEDAKKFLAELNPSEARKSELEEQLKRLEEIHDAKLWSEEQYEQAVQQLRKKYADEDLKERLANVQNYTEQANSVMSEASNFVTALKEAESAQLEAQYQADLTAAGDNAEKREQIEAEYEQKQLDLKKKYADSEMAVNIAKTIANGAVAAIKAYADAGPVAGAILAALIAATTAAEVATIVAQRNAIKATSVSSTSTANSGSTDNTMQTGTRTITGYSEGGNTKRATSDATVVGVVHANEWVAPAWMVRENPTVFADLEQYRATLGRGRKKLGNGFADGGLASPQSGSMPTPSPLEEIDWQALRDFNAIMRYCATHGIFVKYGDIMIAKEKHDNFKKQTSR